MDEFNDDMLNEIYNELFGNKTSNNDKVNVFISYLFGDKRQDLEITMLNKKIQELESEKSNLIKQYNGLVKDYNKLGEKMNVVISLLVLLLDYIESD